MRNSHHESYPPQLRSDQDNLAQKEVQGAELMQMHKSNH